MSLSHSIDRRHFLKVSGAITAVTAASLAGLGGEALAATPLPAGAIVLPPLPYLDTALEPVISAKTIGFHYGKHHAGYVTNLNNLIAGTKYVGMPLEKIIKATAGKRLLDKMIFNNAAQNWNHTFYWNSLKPGAGDKMLPTGNLLALIKRDFGHFSDPTKDDKGAWVKPGFKQKLFDAAKGHFGSGWAWVVINKKGKLEIMTTSNADVPFTDGLRPLLVIDVWEHAYYLDYQNVRINYLNGVLDSLINWDFAAQNIKRKY
jgi:superoxide dismutase, Fe-Mn family